KIRFPQALGRFLFIVDVKPDVVNAANIGCLPHAKLGCAGFAVFQDREINVAVTEPDSLLTAIAGPAIELGQAEMLLVQFCGLRGIVGHECHMPYSSHRPSPKSPALADCAGLLCSLSAGYRSRGRPATPAPHAASLCRASTLIIAAPFSAIMIVGALVL